MTNKQDLTRLIKESSIDQSLLDACIHCGLCLPACPTYLATGRELESPRGRIYLLNLWQQGQEPFSPRMAEHLDSCLGCLGCQTACPSGVNYEAIINHARQPVNALQPYWVRFFRYLILSRVLPNDILLIRLGKLLRIWQKIQGERFLRLIMRLTWLERLPVVKELMRWQSMLPEISPHQPLSKLTSRTGKKQPIVQLFKGCVMDILYNHVNQASLRLLSLQCQIVAVPKQTCCGALAFHAGEKELACELAKQNMKIFADNEGPIIVTASGCAAMLKTYHELFAPDHPWHHRAKAFSARVQDLPEFLAKYDLPGCQPPSVWTEMPKRIAYHAACHLAHAQGIRLAPKQLLENFVRSVNEANGRETIDLVPLTEEEHCCGSAGIYNLSHPVLSEQILARKLEMIKETGADLVVTTNPGCLLQLEAGMRAQGMNVKVAHLAEVLAQGYLCKSVGDEL